MRRTGNQSSAGSPSAPLWRRAARRGGRQRSRQGRFVAPSLDDLIRPLQERRRDRQAEGLGGLEVDDQLELGRLLYREVSRLRALEDLVDVQGNLPEHVIKIRAVGHEGTGMGILRDPTDGGKLALEAKLGNLCSLREEAG